MVCLQINCAEFPVGEDHGSRSMAAALMANTSKK